MYLKDTDPMPFGKYMRKPMREVPANYLRYLHNEIWRKGMRKPTGAHASAVRDYIMRNRERILGEQELT